MPRDETEKTEQPRDARWLRGSAPASRAPPFKIKDYVHEAVSLKPDRPRASDSSAEMATSAALPSSIVDHVFENSESKKRTSHIGRMLKWLLVTRNAFQAFALISHL